MLLDERMILEPETGERFLIPVGEGPSGSAVALEPWACVEKSYSNRERQTLKAGGRLLVAVEAGATLAGMASPARGGGTDRDRRLDPVDDAGLEGLGQARFATTSSTRARARTASRRCAWSGSPRAAFSISSSAEHA
ncbi:MAG: hypothetical protein U0838_14775 [Chloroflexota bacterium]